MDVQEFSLAFSLVVMNHSNWSCELWSTDYWGSVCIPTLTQWWCKTL